MERICEFLSLPVSLRYSTRFDHSISRIRQTSSQKRRKVVSVSLAASLHHSSASSISMNNHNSQPFNTQDLSEMDTASSDVHSLPTNPAFVSPGYLLLEFESLAHSLCLRRHDQSATPSLWLEQACIQLVQPCKTSLTNRKTISNQSISKPRLPRFLPSHVS